MGKADALSLAPQLQPYDLCFFFWVGPTFNGVQGLLLMYLGITSGGVTGLFVILEMAPG